MVIFYGLIQKNIETEHNFLIYTVMKAKEVLEKYKITRRTLHNWVKRGIINFEKTPSGRYIYLEKNLIIDENPLCGKINKNNIEYGVV
jgi:hypothetical protein